MTRTIKDIEADISVAEAEVSKLLRELASFKLNCPHPKRESATGVDGYHHEKCVRCGHVEII